MTIRYSHPLRVQYEDTDFSGFVYHANFIKYCERARTAYTWSKGVDQNAWFTGEDRMMFVVNRMNCHWQRPARFGDELTVITDFLEIKGARFEARQTVMRGEDVLFTADTTVVLVDGQGRPRRCPPEMLKAFTAP